MKSVVYSWHDGISGPRLAAQFGENTRHLRDRDADGVDNPEEVQRVVDLATKDSKPLPKTLLSLTQIEARLSATLGFRQVYQPGCGGGGLFRHYGRCRRGAEGWLRCLPARSLRPAVAQTIRHSRNPFLPQPTPALPMVGTVVIL